MFDRPHRSSLAFLSCTLFCGLLISVTSSADVEYSPSLGDDYPKEVFWGDTHVHSSFSMDANTIGNTKLSPADAYRFAKGEPIEAHNGMTAQIEAPLDFLVVSDHAEYMGLLPRLRAGDPRVLADPAGRMLFDGLRGGAETAFATVTRLIDSLGTNEPIIDNTELKESIWREITELADIHNQPGRFTALIGYEWTSMPDGDNLHRVVIFRDGAERAGRIIPLSAFEGPDPEDLWTFMEGYEEETGGHILAIPHNMNMSNGRMFAVEDSAGRPFDAAYAQRRARHEPLAEVTQIKGDSETHPTLSPEDPFSDFETWDHGNLLPKPLPKTPEMLQWEYARQALKNGLEQEARVGTNPFKFGMIGSSDAHTALATAREDNFWGKFSLMEPGPDRLTLSNVNADENTSGLMPWDFVASGYAAVWAKENTREALFEAMRRKEVYATTGSRITLRFFGGWDFEKGDAARPNAVRIGYQKGVPMGGDLPATTKGKAPTFLVSALKDPTGANLDRAQIVKGWRDEEGALHERVIDVVLSDGRKKGWFGGVREVGSTVEGTSYTNTIGDAELIAEWTDPEFDPDQPAFYYVRVLEIPTPRWTAYDARAFELELAEDVPKELQDRAYSSPIWYTPR